MKVQKLKSKRAERRRFRVRKGIYGTPEHPRLSVFRSNLHIYAQLIDDLNGVTVAAATSAGKNSGLKHGSNITAAIVVGKKIAEAAKAKAPPPRIDAPRSIRLRPVIIGVSRSSFLKRT